MRHEARIKMVDKFITLLGSDEYIYKNEQTTELLVGLIYNAIYSLSRINASDWNVFLAMFQQSKIIALADAKSEKEKKENYIQAMDMLVSTFEQYNDLLKSADAIPGTATKNQKNEFTVSG